ncbi:MAG: hypothetical protein ACFFEV_03015 [Candidatus Thorarchaeota archaeon]
MLTDFELFVVTWLLAGAGFLSLYGVIYSSSQIWFHRKKLQMIDQQSPEINTSSKSRIHLRYLSILSFFLSCIAGGIITITNWIPVTEYNHDTVLYRVLSVGFGSFLMFLLLGGFVVYAVDRVLRESHECG